MASKVDAVCRVYALVTTRSAARYALAQILFRIFPSDTLTAARV